MLLWFQNFPPVAGFRPRLNVSAHLRYWKISQIPPQWSLLTGILKCNCLDISERSAENTVKRHVLAMQRRNKLLSERSAKNTLQPHVLATQNRFRLISERLRKEKHDEAVLYFDVQCHVINSCCYAYCWYFFIGILCMLGFRTMM